jgi:ANTAR domain/GAF domain
LLESSAMSAPPWSAYDKQPVQQALQSLATSAAANIAGVDFASVSVRRKDQTLDTVAATDPLAMKLDTMQYELGEGPCYAAVTDERFVVVNDLAAHDNPYPRFGPRAVELGVRAQTAIQLENSGEQAGLNLYARKPDAFDHSTMQFAELFSNQAGVLLGYARQVGSLGEALQSRQDIGTAVGITMQRYGVDRDEAFGFLVRISNDRNIRLREIAHQVIEGTFDPTAGYDKLQPDRTA